MLIAIIIVSVSEQYTQAMLRQTTEVVLDGLADPASVVSTSQG
jgi:hypothetical protein